MKIIFEPHSITTDNEANVASGWNDVELSAEGIKRAKERSGRFDITSVDAIFVSDLQRAINSAKLALPDIEPKKLFIDWRLRECDYGDLELIAKDKLDQEKIKYIDEPFPNGESYRQAMERMKSFLEDLKKMPFQTVLVIGSRATHYGLDVWIDGKTIEDCLKTKFAWQPDWQYEL